MTNSFWNDTFSLECCCLYVGLICRSLLKCEKLATICEIRRIRIVWPLNGQWLLSTIGGDKVRTIAARVTCSVFDPDRLESGLGLLSWLLGSSGLG